MSIEKCTFQYFMKLGNIYKKGNRLDKHCYRPVTILSKYLRENFVVVVFVVVVVFAVVIKFYAGTCQLYII